MTLASHCWRLEVTLEHACTGAGAGADARARTGADARARANGGRAPPPPRPSSSSLSTVALERATLLPVVVPPGTAVVPPVAVVVPPVVVLSLDVLKPVAVVVPRVAVIGGVMELTLASWQMRFSVSMDEVLNLWLLCDVDVGHMLCTYAVSERFFFWILIPAYVARNICPSANTIME